MNDSIEDAVFDQQGVNHKADSFHSLDDFMASVCSKDSNVRLGIFSRLEDYLRWNESRLDCMDLNEFCNGILTWISSSSFKISMNGLIIIQLLCHRLGDKLRNNCTEIVAVVVDRLADSKEEVRAAAKSVLISLMTNYTPNYIWDKLGVGFNHKLPKAKEETLILLEKTLNKFRTSNFHVSKLLITNVVKLLADTNQSVRDRALETIIEMYRHVGDRFRNELKKKQIPEAKLKLIFSKFDDVVRRGELKEEG